MPPSIGYMHLEIIQHYYSRLKLNVKSSGDAAGQLWGNILPRYFTADKGYGIEYELKSGNEPSHNEPFATVRNVMKLRGGKLATVIVVLAARMVDVKQSMEWSDIERRAQEVAVNARGQNKDTEPVYAVATLGCSSRFYRCLSDDGKLEHLWGTKGETYDFSQDEVNIDRLLCALVSQTS